MALQSHQPAPPVHGCILSGPTDLCMPSLFMCSVIWCSSTKGTSFLLQPLLLVLRTQHSWRLVLIVKAFSTSTFSMSFVTRVPASFSSMSTFFLTCLLSTETSLPFSGIPHQIQFHLNFGWKGPQGSWISNPPLHPCRTCWDKTGLESGGCDY